MQSLIEGYLSRILVQACHQKKFRRVYTKFDEWPRKSQKYRKICKWFCNLDPCGECWCWFVQPLSIRFERRINFLTALLGNRWLGKFQRNFIWFKAQFNIYFTKVLSNPKIPGHWLKQNNVIWITKT